MGLPQLSERQTPQGITTSNSRHDPEDRAYHAHIALRQHSPERNLGQGLSRNLRETPRRPVCYNDSSSPPELGYESFVSSTDSAEEEDERIEKSMGVIRKKTAARGTEGGTKYHCDVCSVDITSTVRLLLSLRVNKPVPASQSHSSNPALSLDY